jgi:hypothetical protein
MVASPFGATVPVAGLTNGNLSSTLADTTQTKTVSDFITVQSLTNFAAMTGAVTAVWGGVQSLVEPTAWSVVPVHAALSVRTDLARRVQAWPYNRDVA